MIETHVQKSKGEIYEGIAFQFCKVATVVVILGRLALPVAAGLCAIFYVLAIANGKKDTKCWLRYPWILVALWGSVAIISTAVLINPSLLINVLEQLGIRR